LGGPYADSATTFVAQTNVAGSNGYGKFSINAAGVWTYTMNNAPNEFVGCADYTDSITVATADGTTQTITVTIKGTDDATVITGTSTANLTETNAAQSTGFEAFAPFAAAVVLAQLAGVDGSRIGLLAVAFIVCRVLHGVFYIANKAPLRSLAWVGGFACVVVLLVQAAVAATGHGVA